MAKIGIYQPIDTTPGVQPSTDKTAVNTPHFTYADKIRFSDGTIKKIGGWISTAFDYGQQIVGTIRTIFTDNISGKYYTALGTNKRLYGLIGSNITNITPFVTMSNAAANSISTHFNTLGSNPFSAVSGSSTLTVTDSQASLLQPGDDITLSGATGFAGILAGTINGVKLVRTVGTGTYTINVGTAANTTTTGGGASVVRSSGLITITDTNTQANGDRVKISGAVASGGITAPQINDEFIVRNASGTAFDVMTTGTATSAVTAAGGSSTVYFIQIPEGILNETNTQGYGAGMYGAGLYGTALVSSTGRAFPRIWFADRYANTMILTPGNQGGVYQWFGDVAVAPVLVENAPTAVNYIFVQDNILVTFGAPAEDDPDDDQENRIFASDQDNITNWTSSSTNQVFDDNIEGAGRLLTHCPVEDYSLIFTENQTYTFKYLGLPFVWEIKPLDETIGIISPMARVSAKSMAFWMGLENFYFYRGGTVEVIPANSQAESTCLNYVFEDLNWGQKSKIHCWYNKDFNEIWFHYPSANSMECDRTVVVNILDFTWTLHMFNRTASEYPGAKLKNPRLANVGTLYQHELGVDDDGTGMSWIFSTEKRYYGRQEANVYSVIPDAVQTGNVKITVDAYQYPQSALAIGQSIQTITPTTERVPFNLSGRYNQYTLQGSDLGQEFIAGSYLEEVAPGSTQ